ncbi:hypothetical protein MMC14_002002 [Varicellaria rhodocarpa]|nr:hypothetical protein [Varicellaria rhodocarpa]
MPFRTIAFIYRKPGTTPQSFQSHYENIHIPLLQSLFGTLMPQHTRFYLPRLNTPSTSSSTGDSNTIVSFPPIVLSGSPQDFEDQEHCMAVQAKMKEFQEAIEEDEEKFMQRGRFLVVKVDEPVVTRGGGTWD